ncbi:hypothetical protein PVA38_12230 [Streptococcus pneumoniae D39]|nr:hypothetical protein PVA38_12230 [Streptococcus pneumoniae D39]
MVLVFVPVSYTHLRAHETVLDLVCRLLLEQKNIHLYLTYFLTHPLYYHPLPHHNTEEYQVVICTFRANIRKY